MHKMNSTKILMGQVQILPMFKKNIYFIVLFSFIDFIFLLIDLIFILLMLHFCYNDYQFFFSVI